MPTQIDLGRPLGHVPHGFRPATTTAPRPAEILDAPVSLPDRAAARTRPGGGAVEVAGDNGWMRTCGPDRRT
ncbi:hypothetical protein [Streptomyces sp. NBC_00203]|uniref:hypothetical protein n=1 Tax=Streptomyces sp. NBC_00203 TaxID=2975680 RepID=UPI003253A5AA